MTELHIQWRTGSKYPKQKVHSSEKGSLLLKPKAGGDKDRGTPPDLRRLSIDNSTRQESRRSSRAVEETCIWHRQRRDHRCTSRSRGPPRHFLKGVETRSKAETPRRQTYGDNRLSTPTKGQIRIGWDSSKAHAPPTRGSNRWSKTDLEKRSSVLTIENPTLPLPNALLPHLDTGEGRHRLDLSPSSRSREPVSGRAP